MRTLRVVLSALPALALSLAACGGAEERGEVDAAPSDEGVCADAGDADLLAEVCERGVVTVSTDPAYPPQSSLDKDTNEYVGFDIDVATEIASRMGLEVAWETPSWDVITSGGWNDRWQLSVGSMTPTNDRQQVLNFTEPYYFTPAVVVVHEDNTSVQDVSTDLDGAKIGVCSACTYEQFLDKSLAIEGFEFDFVIDDAVVTGYDTDTTALQDLALGDGDRLDAVITSLTTAQGFADSGKPVKIVGEPVFYEPLAVAIDQKSEADPATFVEAVDGIVAQMHDDGTLSELSKKWYDGTDLTVQQ
ncbi:MAG: transporter substrate-binding domain-containing protein [Nocardioidaceae bacterium]|nr:transporter substrate-binding domain-containing protein [Nocardioidaceae bacterium]